VISLIVLFVALGGTPYAAVTALVPRNSVGSAQVINGSLQTGDLSVRRALRAGPARAARPERRGPCRGPTSRPA
jgi:hypothetical protein